MPRARTSTDVPWDDRKAYPWAHSLAEAINSGESAATLKRKVRKAPDSVRGSMLDWIANAGFPEPEPDELLRAFGQACKKRPA
jgi:hypothetical protein